MAESNPVKATSDVKSGTERDEVIKLAGGLPPKKDVEAIDKANSPSSRKSAPGSVRV
jgi:hypothetical protein